MSHLSNSGKAALLHIERLDAGDLAAFVARIDAMLDALQNSTPGEPLPKSGEASTKLDHLAHLAHSTFYETAPGKNGALVSFDYQNALKAACASYQISPLLPRRHGLNIREIIAPDHVSLPAPGAPTEVVVANLNRIRLAAFNTLNAIASGDYDPDGDDGSAGTKTRSVARSAEEANRRLNHIIALLLHNHSPVTVDPRRFTVMGRLWLTGNVEVRLAPKPQFNASEYADLFTPEATQILAGIAQPQAALTIEKSAQYSYAIKGVQLGSIDLSQRLDTVSTLRELAALPPLPRDVLTPAAMDLLAAQ